MVLLYCKAAYPAILSAVYLPEAIRFLQHIFHLFSGLAGYHADAGPEVDDISSALYMTKESPDSNHTAIF